MCGINGIYAYLAPAPVPERKELLATRDYMERRGPDGSGEWWSDDHRCALAHRRLSVIDVSDRASQPMRTEDGRYVVTYNGEIYNYPELKLELQSEGAEFRTSSDTEVLLHLYKRHGSGMVNFLRGMYAFAIWDADARRLFLARDPYGIKPLYTANDGWTFRFASQVKALIAGGQVSRAPEPAGIVGFHLFGSVPEPFTIYRDIRSLPAGHFQWVDSAGPHEPVAFASVASTLAQTGRPQKSKDDLLDEVGAALKESVTAHLLSDVEVGLFLSSGIDSSAILGLMHDAGCHRVTAITLAYDEFLGTEADEAPLASVVARQYGAKHIIRKVTSAEFVGDLPRILSAMDQPTIDGVNAWFASKAAFEHGLKVTLSGTGGDELFCGYPSFRDVPRWAKWPRPARLPGLGAGYREMFRTLAPDLARRNPKVLGLLDYGGSYASAYLLRRAVFLPFELDEQLAPDLVAAGLRRLRPVRHLASSISPDPGFPVGRVSALESANYLRNQLLRDADWAGMAHSVEIRAPLVDIRLLKRLAPLLPELAGTAGKEAIAQAPAKPLPRLLLDRKKTGFRVPLRQWAASGITGGSEGLTARAWIGELWRREYEPCISWAP